MFWIGLIIGLFLGGLAGMVFMALLCTAKIDDLIERQLAAHLREMPGGEL